MPKTVYWSEYALWLRCPQWHQYQYNDHLPKEQPTEQMKLGIRLGQALTNRLRNPEWKPTIGFNRNLGSLEGLTQVLKEYDARYSSDRLLGPWKAEEHFSRKMDSYCTTDRPDALTGHTYSDRHNEELGCVVDGRAGDLIRETKVTDNPNLYLFRAQLLWNCFCSGCQEGELDIILRPGYHRPDWAFERLTFTFTEQHKLGLLADVEKFLELSNHLQLWKNPNQCTFCPHTPRCWPDGGKE